MASDSTNKSSKDNDVVDNQNPDVKSDNKGSDIDFNKLFESPENAGSLIEKLLENPDSLKPELKSKLFNLSKKNVLSELGRKVGINNLRVEDIETTIAKVREYE